MLKFLLQVLILIIFGILAYDISQTGSFNKSQTYQFLKEKEIFENAEVFMKKAKKFYSTATVWAEKNIPVYYNETCIHLKPYIILGQDWFFAFKNSATSLIQHIGMYVDENFPAFQNYVSVVLKDTISLVKEGVFVVSKHLQNYAETVIQYANNMYSQR